MPASKQLDFRKLLLLNIPVFVGANAGVFIMAGMFPVGFGLYMLAAYLQVRVYMGEQ